MVIPVTNTPAEKGCCSLQLVRDLTFSPIFQMVEVQLTHLNALEHLPD